MGRDDALSQISSSANIIPSRFSSQIGINRCLLFERERDSRRVSQSVSDSLYLYKMRGQNAELWLGTRWDWDLAGNTDIAIRDNHDLGTKNVYTFLVLIEKLKSQNSMVSLSNNLLTGSARFSDQKQ